MDLFMEYFCIHMSNGFWIYFIASLVYCFEALKIWISCVYKFKIKKKNFKAAFYIKKGHKILEFPGFWNKRFWRTSVIIKRFNREHISNSIELAFFIYCSKVDSWWKGFSDLSLKAGKYKHWKQFIILTYFHDIFIFLNNLWQY